MYRVIERLAKVIAVDLRSQECNDCCRSRPRTMEITAEAWGLEKKARIEILEPSICNGYCTKGNVICKIDLVVFNFSSNVLI